MVHARNAGLIEIRARLNELARIRDRWGFDAADRAEYRKLTKRETQLLRRAVGADG